MIAARVGRLGVVVVCTLVGCTPTASPTVRTASPPAAPATAVDDLGVSLRPGAHPGTDPDALVSLRGDTRNSVAWAPIDHPEAVTAEGSVPSSRAWSTSKPLVIAAYLDTVVDGNPADVPERERRWIRDALSRSDGDAINAIRHQVEHPGAAMTRILRSIGDTVTTAPDSYEGTMQWTVREQVRFMAALAQGEVVSPQASAFLLRNMQPIPEHRWGLGAIGATAFKPGWYRPDTETRQMGMVGNYAVAIITAGDGPAIQQSDGDYAHVWQLDRLAQLLARRIG